MRILMINQAFHPDPVATAQKGFELAREFARAGHEVTAIASRSRYGEVGASLPLEATPVAGVRVLRTGRARFGKGAPVGRALDFLSFYVLAAARALRLPRQDLVICFTTPPFIVLVGLLLRLLRGSRCICWCMDVYPDVVIESGMMRPAGMLARVLRALNRWTLNRCDRVVVLGRCMQARLERAGVRPERLLFVPIWAEPDLYELPLDAPAADNPFRREWELGDETLVMYSGNFGVAHDIDTMLDAALAARSEPGLRFAFVGSGARKEAVDRFIREHGLERTCHVLPLQPSARLADLLSAADVHLATMAPGFEGTVVPSKVSGSLAAGRPTIFIGPAASEAALLVRDADPDWAVTPGDPAALLAALQRFRAAATDGQAARIAARRAAVAAGPAVAFEGWLRLVADPHA